MSERVTGQDDSNPTLELIQRLCDDTSASRHQYVKDLAELRETGPQLAGSWLRLVGIVDSIDGVTPEPGSDARVDAIALITRAAVVSNEHISPPLAVHLPFVAITARIHETGQYVQGNLGAGEHGMTAKPVADPSQMAQ